MSRSFFFFFAEIFKSQGRAPDDRTKRTENEGRWEGERRGGCGGGEHCGFRSVVRKLR